MVARRLKAVDLFCGAGGTTSGAVASGCVEVVLAVNHWRVAVQTHRENHPGVRHVCAEIDMVDPRDFLGMGIDLILASPECVFHSLARGGKPVDDQRRATAWCVPRWAEALRPKWIVVENVREFEDWAPLGTNGRPMKTKKGEIFQAWVQALRALNYHVEWRLLNAADYGEATKRTRLFIIARRGRSTSPIAWPAPSHAKADWTPAHRIIDWQLPCPSIFDRKRPLAEKTLRRIEIGIKKFVEPFIVNLRNNESAASIHDPLNRGRKTGVSKSISDPLPTIVAARENHAVVIPYLVPNFGERDGQDPRSHSVDAPLPTVTGHGAGGLVMPFVSTFHNGSDGPNRNSSVDDPLPVVDTQPRHAIVQPFLLDANWGDNRGGRNRVHSPDDPLCTVTTQQPQAVVAPFMIDVNHGDDRHSGDRSRSLDEPLGTVTGTRGQAVVAPFLVPRQGHFDCRKDKPCKSVDEPLGTVTANHSPAHLVLPFLADVHHGSGESRVGSVDDPLGTIVTKPGNSIVMPFVTEYFANGSAKSVDEPLSVVTTKHRHGLTLVKLMQELGIVDIGFRMLEPAELAAAQGFAPGYQIFGSKAEQIKQIGNSVCCKVASAICEALGKAG